MQIFKEASQRSVEVCSWEKFKAINLDTARAFLYDKTGQLQSTVIFLHWTWEESVNRIDINMLYGDLLNIAAHHGAVLRCFPSQTEALQSRAKLGDMRALDEIALQAKQYRPKTCYPYQECELQDQEITMHKRTDSCGKDHVEAKHSGNRSNLTCFVSGEQLKKRTLAKQRIWFHQEFVHTFEQFGEFRVFIVTEPSATGLRGRQGKVVCIAHTKWSHAQAESHANEIYASAAERVHFRRPECAPLTEQDLRMFSLAVYEKLRARPDWLEHFESLEVGVRLDIGISPAPNEKSFFVSDITRFWLADFFSHDVLPRPNVQLCEAYAVAMRDYFCKDDLSPVSKLNGVGNSPMA
jgi:hypothetical protein